jgi:hypothetical protein
MSILKAAKKVVSSQNTTDFTKTLDELKAAISKHDSKIVANKQKKAQNKVASKA